MNYKNKVHETETEIVYEVEEVVPLEEKGIYNTTYLAESMIATVRMNDSVLVRYLYKEKKPEVIKAVNSVTVEYATNYGVKKLAYNGIDKDSFSVTQESSPYVMCRAELSFNYGGFE